MVEPNHCQRFLSRGKSRTWAHRIAASRTKAPGCSPAFSAAVATAAISEGVRRATTLSLDASSARKGRPGLRFFAAFFFSVTRVPHCIGEAAGDSASVLSAANPRAIAARKASVRDARSPGFDNRSATSSASRIQLDGMRNVIWVVLARVRAISPYCTISLTDCMHVTLR